MHSEDQRHRKNRQKAWANDKNSCISQVLVSDLCHAQTKRNTRVDTPYRYLWAMSICRNASFHTWPFWSMSPSALWASTDRWGKLNHPPNLKSCFFLAVAAAAVFFLCPFASRVMGYIQPTINSFTMWIHNFCWSSCLWRFFVFVNVSHVSSQEKSLRQEEKLLHHQEPQIQMLS